MLYLLDDTVSIIVILSLESISKIEQLIGLWAGHTVRGGVV